ncbi:MAG: hypothetical protein ACREFX_08980 [Opitutaceae bacterium]
MNEPVPAVADEEQLARYVYFKGHVRADQTVRPDAFIPHPHLELSVTRHRRLEEAAIWRIGARIGAARSIPLVGRADVLASDFRLQTLTVNPDPIQGNPNHARVAGWPRDKPAQKNLAQRIVSQYHPAPA